MVETNHYAAACREVQAPTRAGRRRPWYDNTVEEMKAYVDMCILMGVVVLPHIEMYVSRYLHVCNSTKQVGYGQPGYDPLFKLLDLVHLCIQSV